MERKSFFAQCTRGLARRENNSRELYNSAMGSFRTESTPTRQVSDSQNNAAASLWRRPPVSIFSGNAGARDNIAPFQTTNIFESEFPALVGSTPGPAVSINGSEIVRPLGAGTNETALVDRMRLEKLEKQYSWVDKSVIRSIFESSQGSLTASEIVLEKIFKISPVGCAVNLDDTGRARRLIHGDRSTPCPRIGAPSAAGVRARDISHVRNLWVSHGQSFQILYEKYRAPAWRAEENRDKFFRQANSAGERGQLGMATQLRTRACAANERVKKLHEKAADQIFRAMNPTGCSDRIDLHGLHIEEALKRLSTAMRVVTKDTYLVITGAGSHSKSPGKPKLRPAVEEWLKGKLYQFENVWNGKGQVGAFIVFMERGRCG